MEIRQQTIILRPTDRRVILRVIFCIFQSKNILWILKRTSQLDGSFEQPKHMFKLIDKEIITISRTKVCLSGPRMLSMKYLCRQFG